MQGHGRIYLSSPHLSGEERQFVDDAIASNWVAPLGPHVNAFESEFAATIGAGHAVALSSGTAALHLGLILAGVRRNDEVFVSTFTFAATVNPIVYIGARPVFIDSETTSWNVDPSMLADAIVSRAKVGRLPAAVVLVHLYGQSADIDPVVEVCDRYRIPLIEDAAEALGASYHGRSPGTFGLFGAFSFNGNKIITTSGGGMLVADDEQLAAHARKLAAQARDPAPHYEHSEIGFNYRLSNLLAGVGRAQLRVLRDRVTARRAVFAYYRAALEGIPGIGFMPEAPWGTHTRWLSCITIDSQRVGVTREDLRLSMEEQNIESRPLWKPMHLQPVFSGYESVGGEVAAKLFAEGLCLPSGSNLSIDDLRRIVGCVRRRVGVDPDYREELSSVSVLSG